ncbi:CocE/NonD family hydrolase, partial [candidate division KSB1 bacterium]|nr:CocE/NonD family hydrolase [candidate division KSB1 bacterium]
MRRYAYILFVSIIFSANSFAESTAKTTYMVPMRDGVKLATDVYRPLDLSPHPVLLYRTRYNKNNNPLAGLITLLNLRGYVGVIQDTRGRYASGGVDSVFITDGWGTLQDGYDTIEWLTHQSWCNDQIGMLGASADGISTYRAVGSLHPALKCAVAMVAPTDFYHQVVYPGGEYRKSLCEGYLSEQNTAWMIDYYLQNPYYNQIWQDMNWHTRTDSIKIPMLHIGGWYDSFSEGTVAAFQDLLQKLHAASQHLIMGPWTHGTIGSDGAVGEMHYPDAGLDIYNHIIQWFDHWLLGYDNGVDHAPPVHYYLMGDPDKPGETGCGWMETETWPPSDTTILSLYLTVDGKLQHQPGLIGRRSFTYDPDHPVPTLGGNNLTI